MSVNPVAMAVAPPTEQVREYTADDKQARKMSTDAFAHEGVQQRMWGFAARLDRSVTFEEFTHWAKVERELEEIEWRQNKPVSAGSGGIKGYFLKNRLDDDKVIDNGNTERGGEKNMMHSGEESESSGIKAIAPNNSGDLDAEWRTASRALRTAGWGAIFYLITTDILGWGQTPYVFSNTGYGLGVGIFVLMGIAAGFSGLMIWKTFMGLDSSRFPMVTFGDPFFRLFGPGARHFVNAMQALQLLVIVSIVILGQTYVLAQLAGSVDLCFIACGVIVLVVCIASGYMRSLKHLGWFCNTAVWLNVISFIIICVAAAKYGPDPTAAVASGPLNKAWITNPAPVKTFVGTPPPKYQPTDKNLFAAKFNGINSMVYAYSGAILFIAFLSEMRHPMDWWKAMMCAQLFITVTYIFFGAFGYTYYGQYSFGSINQVVKPLGLQIVSNVLALVTGWIAVFLYFNVGMKTIYIELGQEIFGLPQVSTTKGKYLWWALGPIYWAIAFVIAMSIPQFNAFVNFVGALFGLNFTYSFAGIMYAAFLIQDAARLPGEGFDPMTGVTTRHDSGMKRLTRGFKKSIKLSLPCILFAMAGLAASGMGTWAAIEGLITAFSGGSLLTSWTCLNPFYVPPAAKKSG